jgi:hypothetical protein
MAFPPWLLLAFMANHKDYTQRKRVLLSVAWGVFLAVALGRHFFQLEKDSFYKNDDATGYLLRQIQFQDCIANGYLSPQWCSDFRSGLGSPFFSFYQSGWFYFTAIFAWCPNVVWQLGLATIAITFLGYWGMLRLVASRFGWLAGGMAGTFFVSAEYPATDLWIRGDFSEYAAMMLVPYWIHALLDTWHDTFDRLDETTSRSWILPWATGGIAIMHPCVAMQVAFMGTAFILVLMMWYRSMSRLRNTVLALVTGVALAGVYWVTWLGEFRYVQPHVATEGFFHYSKNFAAFMDLFNSEKTTTVTNVKFGSIQRVVILYAAALSIYGWNRWTKDQRTPLFLASVAMIISFFLINPWSEFLWQHVPLLKLQQFPWRFLVFVTIGASVVVGVLGGQVIDEKWRFAGALLLLLAVVSRVASVKPETTPFTQPKSVRDIASVYFAPDVGNEWLPKDATEFAIGEPLQKTYTGPAELAFSEDSSIHIRDARLLTGQIDCDLSSKEASQLTLRHYFYPVGWRAMLDEKQIFIERSSQGLMQIAIPANFDGKLSLQFSTTLMRRWGLAISIMTAVALAIFQLRTRQSQK